MEEREHVPPSIVPVEEEQTWDHSVEGLPLFKVDTNQTWNGFDKVIVITVPTSAVCVEQSQSTVGEGGGGGRGGGG